MTLDDLLYALPRAWRWEDRDGPVASDNPAAGQCMLSSLLIRKHNGGKIITARVSGFKHYWNELENGMWVDSTRKQFPVASEIRAVRYKKAGEGIFTDTWIRVDALERRVELILKEARS